MDLDTLYYQTECVNTTWKLTIVEKNLQNPKALFAGISCATGDLSRTMKSSNDKCEKFLCFFIDKIDNIIAKWCSQTSDGTKNRLHYTRLSLAPLAASRILDSFENVIINFKACLWLAASRLRSFHVQWDALLRSWGRPCLVDPQSTLETKVDWVFSIRGARLWNAQGDQESKFSFKFNVSSVKSLLKAHIFQSAFPRSFICGSILAINCNKTSKSLNLTFFGGLFFFSWSQIQYSVLFF